MRPLQLDWIALVDVVVMTGLAVVCPMALGSSRFWRSAAPFVFVSFLLQSGPAAALLSGAWLVVALWQLGSAIGGIDVPSLRTARSSPGILTPTGLRTSSGLDLVTVLGTRLCAVVASAFLVQSRGGLELLGVREPIVELTAVHFTFAGVGALTLARQASRHVADRGVGQVAVLVTAVAPVIVAAGFLFSNPIPQVGGAVLMSVGALSTAALQLHEARDSARSRRGWLLLSGVMPWIPMVLAVSWAAANYWEVPALSIPDMARTHGLMNVVFVIAGLLARRDDVLASLATTKVVATGPAHPAELGRS